ncbi:MAG: hypothetical protein PHH11_04360 [Methylomonas sp.]|nr:hypothetical protein [Methylomonas sp.]
MIRFKKLFACATVMLIAYSPANHASTTGVLDSGNPSFVTETQISLANFGSGFMLLATNANAPITFNLENPDISVTSTTASFQLTAEFDTNGAYVTNSGGLRIYGELPFPGVPDLSLSGRLLTADLENFTFADDKIGFSVVNQGGFSTLFGQLETVYLSAIGIASTLGFSSAALITTSNPVAAGAVASVPIPGAGWLIGSAFGVFTLLRRNRTSLESAC